MSPYSLFGFGPVGPIPHRSSVTVCHCRGCVRRRATGEMFQAQTEAVRFVLYLKWLRWVVERDRKDWPATHTADREKLDKEEVN